MTDIKHPTYYYVKQLGDYNIYQKFGETIRPICVALNEDQAKFIVRACNAHEELVGALEDILQCEMKRRADLKTLSMKPSGIYEFSNKRVLRALAALAKARGEA